MKRVLIVGNRGGTNIGAAFERALPLLGYEPALLEMRRAMDAPLWLRHFNWRLRGKRPTHLKQFGESVLAACEIEKPFCVLATGIAPLDANVLQTLAHRGIPTVNFLTDDPFNPAHRAAWFLRALPHYRIVFTTRRANQNDLIEWGCRDVQYSMFAYDPHWHFPQTCGEGESGADRSDLFFAGGADAERAPFLAALVREGFNVALYGDYWSRYLAMRSAYRGYASPERVRCAVSATKICLCLVRRANRDDHVMRTFEIPAMRGCMLTEDTETHRALFGAEGQAVLYFKTPLDLVEQARWLLAHPAACTRLAEAAHQRITGGKNTYRDRLATVLAYVDEHL